MNFTINKIKGTIRIIAIHLIALFYNLVAQSYSPKIQVPPNQSQNYFYHGDEFSNFLNPASISSNGQKIGFGNYSSQSGNQGIDYLVASTHTLPNLFVGYSLISSGSDIGQAENGPIVPSYKEKFHSITLAYKFSLYSKDFDLGTNLNVMTMNLFDIRNENSKSVDVGIVYTLLKNNFHLLKGGLVYQNLISTKITTLPDESEIEVLPSILDLSGFWSYHNKKIYASGSINIYGDDRNFNDYKIVRLGGIMKTFILGTQFVENIDLKIKLTSTGKLTPGICGKAPFFNQIKKIDEISFCLDGNHDILNSTDSNIGLNYTWFVRTIFNLF